jgi:hypothetical protein
MLEELEEVGSSPGSAVTEPSRLLLRGGGLPRIHRAPSFCPSTATVTPKIRARPATQSSPAAGAAIVRRKQGKGKARVPPLAASPPSSPRHQPRAPPLRAVLHENLAYMDQAGEASSPPRRKQGRAVREKTGDHRQREMKRTAANG